MNTIERIKEICKERKIAISRLEKDCKFSNGYIGKLKEGKMPSDRLYTVSKYLNVPFEYLQTGVETSGNTTYVEIMAKLPELDMAQLDSLQTAIKNERIARYLKEIQQLRQQLEERSRQ